MTMSPNLTLPPLSKHVHKWREVILNWSQRVKMVELNYQLVSLIIPHCQPRLPRIRLSFNFTKFKLDLKIEIE